MKFKHYLKEITDVSMYPMFTLILFFVIFILAAILVFSKSKKTLSENAQIPLKD